MPDEVEPNAEGLLRCLYALADEAAQLELPQTYAALHEAIAACRDETRPSRPASDSPSSHTLIH